MPASPFSERFLVVSRLSTTGDEHQVCVSKDAAEVIEFAWILLEAETLKEIHRDAVLIRPVNTPVTDLCTSSTTLTWADVEGAGTLQDAIFKFDATIRDKLSGPDADFAFIVLDAWDLRVQVVREARDKGSILPPFLQYPRLYDIRQEYTRWQTMHPETLSFVSSSLTNICAALAVDMVSSRPASSENGLAPPFANSQPRRAIVDCVNILQVLRALVRQSDSTGTVPLFKSPMDAGADIEAFIAEESKILHLSGLAFDTTQSELESWFTQHGGRPIAFWTLRTPDQQKPTGTGFAVFSSHQEASESLAMNGRALNDRTIEVSPSSPRVLERATDILIPFPPSKNRPRPGDWSCPSCGFSNFQRRTACFRCSFPSTGNSQMGPSHSAGSDQGYYSGAGMHSVNVAPPHNAMHSSMRGLSNSSVPFRAGDWSCVNCAFHNFARNFQCLKCGCEREAGVR